LPDQKSEPENKRRPPVPMHEGTPLS